MTEKYVYIFIELFPVDFFRFNGRMIISNEYGEETTQ